MRKLVVVNMMSLDGYYAGPGGDFSSFGVDDGFNKFNANAIAEASAVLVGRTSYDDFSQYWPTRDQDVDASDAEKQFAVPYREIQKHVVTSHAADLNVPVEWRGSVDTIDSDIVNSVESLKQDGEGSIVMWGSHSLWHELAKHALVDEIHLVIGNGSAGSGTPVLDPSLKLALQPIEARLLDSSVCVAVKYLVKNQL